MGLSEVYPAYRELERKGGPRGGPSRPFSVCPLFDNSPKADANTGGIGVSAGWQIRGYSTIYRRGVLGLFEGCFEGFSREGAEIGVIQRFFQL